MICKFVTAAVENAERRYSGILSAANSFELLANGSQRIFVLNIRFIVPFYDEIVHCFLRMTKVSTRLSERQRMRLQRILNLTFKAHKDEGDYRLAWPLFVKSLESGNILHRTWILTRYDALSTQGDNYHRARQALRVAFNEKKLRIEFIDLLSR